MSDDIVEVRVLGRLSVRRGDGTFIENHEWRTGKTADLLRLLALAGGRAVPVPVLLDRLWPAVPEEKGRASLRTAASQIRRTVGSDCIERRPDGLALVNAWVDATSFSAMVREIRELALREEHGEVVRIAREAEALYAGDLERATLDQPWITESRDQLLLEHLELLTEAAASACALGWFTDALDLADQALQSDRLAERPHRTLMAAYAGRGEAGQALRTYETFRQLLADELGADPSPQTQALHMEILCGSSRFTGAARPRFAPHRRHVEQLIRLVAEVPVTGGRAVVALAGQAGAGRCEVVATALEWLGDHGWRIFPVTDEQVLAAEIASWGPDDRTLVALPRAHCSVETLDLLLDSPDSSGTVVVAVPKPENLQDDFRAAIGWPVREVEVTLLDREELRAVTTTALDCPLSEAALDELLTVSQGLLRDVESTVASWLDTGRLTATASGLDLAEGGRRERPGCAAFTTLRQLSPADLDVAATLAIFRGPASADRLGAGLYQSPRPSDVADVRERLDRMADVGVLRLTPYGYRFREEQVRDAAENWLRPTRRRVVHRRFAGCTGLGSEERAHHWMRAGEPAEAVHTMLGAADRAAQAGQGERALNMLHDALRHARDGALGADQEEQVLHQVSATAAMLEASGNLSLTDGHDAQRMHVVRLAPRYGSSDLLALLRGKAPA